MVNKTMYTQPKLQRINKICYLECSCGKLFGVGK